jgi:predicted alpha/beta-hydrolase family hydrolase
MLFVQGSKDKLAEPALIGDVTHKLSSKARLHIIKEADHSLHVPARSGRTDEDVIAEAADVVVEWLIGRSAVT